MKKSLLLVFMFLATFFVCLNNAEAATVKKAKLVYSSVNLRLGPGTNYDQVRTLAIYSTYTLVEPNIIPNEQGCPDGWYKIYYSGQNVGYVCSSYVEVIEVEETPPVANTECETQMRNLNFPQSYWAGLCELKAKYPSWEFEPDFTGLDFNVAVSKESVVGKSLIQTSSQGFLSTDVGSYDFLTDRFKVMEGSNWYAANSAVVAYYMDPRNFLDEQSIFMFEKLSYDASYQTLSAVQSVLSGRDIAAESQTILNAAAAYRVNAIFLASRIRQETGGNYSNYSIAGNSVTVGGVYYPHIYNPYNIGANTGAGDGLVWAANGTSYQRPWTNLQTAISGGAQMISESYIAVGQDSNYFQKFNVSSYCSHSPYSHQYMTNVKAPTSEAKIAYEGYANMGLLSNTAFKFVIPVYDNMPASASALPHIGNPNNRLNNLTVNGKTIPGFSYDNYNYNYYVATGVSSINVEASTINGNATVAGVGKVSLPNTQNTVTVKVTAQNGAVQNYVINVIKTDGIDMSVNDIIISSETPVSDNMLLFTAGYDLNALNSKIKGTAATAEITVQGKGSGLLATGDVVTIKNGNDSITYNVVINGDPSGDGNINIQDLLKVQKYILGVSDLQGSYLKAGDTNKDGIVNIQDLLRVQKHILGFVVIE